MRRRVVDHRGAHRRRPRGPCAMETMGGEAAEQEGCSWAYLDWASPGFGVQDDDTNRWDQPILDAFLPTATG